jgi:crotonobetainyl-CoA:carnitine CoA-transferase CaiB-like acyl-CoA transferase
MGALGGTAVLELGDGAGIGYAGKLFADLGAGVTRIATVGSGERARAGALYLDARKEFAVINLADEAGRSRAYEMIGRSQVLLIAAGDPHLHECGITPEALSSKFGDLVVTAVTPFGLDEAVRHRPADDLTLQAMGGISLGIGLPGQPPLKLPGDQSAFQAGLSAAIAALGALLSRRGALIDVAAADVWAAFYVGVEVALAHFGRGGKHRSGHRVSGQPYPRTIFRCKDGYFAIQCGESRHWEAFLRLIGREELATHPLFTNRFKASDEHGDACDALIEPWFLARTKSEILAETLQHKIPGAPVYELGEVIGHSHLRERGYFRVAQTDRGGVVLAGDPYVGLTRPHGTADMRSAAEAVPSRVTRGAARTAGDVPRSDKRRPLVGTRVVDFGWVWAGAVPGHVLADLGAEVIKVESAKPLDYMRQGRPIVGAAKDPEQNPMFQNVNRGKLSLRVTLDHPQASAVLKDLIAVSDVVIENFAPGVMEKFGLDYATLKQVRPDLVMCSMSAVGQTGPLRGIRTYATMIASLAGLDACVGYQGGRVLGSQSSYADPNASLHATFGILAALHRRQHTGEGAYIDLSQWEAAVNVMGEEIVEFALNRSLPTPRGTLHRDKAPHGNYPARGENRWVAISIATDRDWGALRECLSNPAWMAHERFASTAARQAHRDELDRHLAQETALFDAQALAARLAAAGVAASPLLDARGIAESEYFRQRQLFEMVEHPVLGALPVYRLPWHVDGAPMPVVGRAPLLGEHNTPILQQMLGYPEAKLGELTEAGVFA